MLTESSNFRFRFVLVRGCRCFDIPFLCVDFFCCFLMSFDATFPVTDFVNVSSADNSELIKMELKRNSAILTCNSSGSLGGAFFPEKFSLLLCHKDLMLHF